MLYKLYSTFLYVNTVYYYSKYKKITYEVKSSAIFFNEKLFLIRHVIVRYNTNCVRVMNGDEYASYFVMRFSFKRDRSVDSEAVL